MFRNLRRMFKYRFVRLLSASFLLCVLIVCWEDLEHHMFRHVRSYKYRYLANNFDFLNSYVHPSKDELSRIHPYLINHPEKCKTGRRPDNVLLLLFVKSSPENFGQRQAIRDTWGDERFAREELGVSLRLVFAIGIHPDVTQRSTIQKVLQQEDQVNADLIQQDFVDTFHNLTAKLILQFQWTHVFCPQAQFLMTADDDVFVHMPNLVKYLQYLLSPKGGSTDLWVGHVHRGSPPNRRKASKYHVPYELYPWPSYPDYTAGAGYVVSRDVAAKIYQATLHLTSFMYIDDVFMGICAKTMKVLPQEHVYFAGEAKAPYHPCIYDHMITSHGHTADVRSLWKDVVNHSKHKQSQGFMSNLYCRAVRVMLLCLPHYQSTYSCMAAFM
ncbi:lactosylceramide 1,3-N-acetyl-beta-D-glucosaminyltransferase A [Gouania willdenowi]|uniref:Hexosyltransferase n=1 Tax=Gouania willdenowi TaxID=441366 RepID=A0A8C5DWF3_GOUWI|nr:lactosylceramide 1,3-N-acetyl-beta-D-glucosaminyltransferase A-like [Gouania willdenowi]XP_028299242.1 lactosylceramide 1,3-N-acetyl-beta-D-glucosaminyltransferase A-like [Gouania willdenowi]